VNDYRVPHPTHVAVVVPHDVREDAGDRGLRVAARTNGIPERRVKEFGDR
jgi:hypothetical protein